MEPTWIDFLNVTQRLVPEGRYEVTVDNLQMTQSQNYGVHYISWQFRITHGDYANRYLSARTSLQPDTLWRLQELLAALGIDVIGHVAINADDIKGMVLLVTVKHREFDGDLSEEIIKFTTLEEHAHGTGILKSPGLNNKE